jgi:hypothetical protein
VILAAPFRGEWLVVNGGRSALINIHYGHASERDALDIERIVNGQERTGDRKRWTSYPSWGETLYAPADGKIAKVVNDLDDNPLGQRDEEHVVGNQVVIEMGNGRFVLMAHLQKGSVLVAGGDIVRTGQPIAKCGNSGNTTGPHLHLQVQSGPDFYAPDLKTYPILFRDVTCMRSARPRSDAPFFVRRNDRIISEPRPEDRGSNAVVATPTFGPMIERIITLGEVGPDGLAFVNLEKAEVMRSPFLLQTSLTDPGIFQRSARIDDWIAASGLDLALHLTDGNWGFVPLGTQLIFHEDNLKGADFLERIPPDEARNLLTNPKTRQGHYASLGARVSAYPVTSSYIFKTRRGMVGLLQISGFTNDVSGVKLRYRLMPSGRAAGEGTETSRQNPNPTNNETQP